MSKLRRHYRRMVSSARVAAAVRVSTPSFSKIRSRYL
jgi:hypothetical protein